MTGSGTEAAAADAGDAGAAGPLIFLVAGEPSGDQLGARLMAALKQETGGRVRFAGVGGELMTAEGLRSEEHTSELQSLMRISYAVFCLKKKKNQRQPVINRQQ